jgi:ribosomal protein S18 acetylase RimI-like enzyme
LFPAEAVGIMILAVRAGEPRRRDGDRTGAGPPKIVGYHDTRANGTFFEQVKHLHKSLHFISEGTPVDYTIRPLEEIDFAEFIELRQSALRLSPESFGTDYDQLQTLSVRDRELLEESILNYPYKYIIGAFALNGSLIGTTGFTVKRSQMKLRHKGEIWGMYVIPEYRRRAIAEGMLQRVMLAAKEDADCEQILLRVASQNTSAFRLYQKLGFVQIGAEPHALKLRDGSYVDEIIMLKFL